jgi:hypothetical protein
MNAARMAVSDWGLFTDPAASIVAARQLDLGIVSLDVQDSSGLVKRIFFDPLSGHVWPLSGGVSTLAAVEAPFDPNNMYIKDFSPVAAGYKWWYHDVNTGENFQINCLGQQQIHGAMTWKTQRTRPWPESDYDLIEMTDRGSFVHYRHIVARAGQAQDMDLDPPVKFTEAKVELGKAFSTEPRMVNPATGNTTIWTGRVEKLETLTVPAGTFPCLRIRLSIRDSKLGTRLAEAEMYYGYRVGLVKRSGQFFGVYFFELLDRHNLPSALGATGAARPSPTRNARSDRPGVSP